MIKYLIRQLISGGDYQSQITSILAIEQSNLCGSLLYHFAKAKLHGQKITWEWYKENPPDEIPLPSQMVSAQSLIPLLTSHSEANAFFDLIGSDAASEIGFTIRFKNVSIDLNLSESLIVINTLAVKRAQLTGGFWSTAGKQVEAPLMLTLSKLFGVPHINYRLRGLSNQSREVDFHFVGKNGQVYNCEVKLMGRGNPESADAIFARDTQIFVADTLSALNKAQLAQNGTHWVELRSNDGYRKLMEVLELCAIPYEPFDGNLDMLDEIIPQVFNELNQA